MFFLARNGYRMAVALFAFGILVMTNASAQDQHARGKVAIVVHGGAGTILRENMSPEREEAYRAALEHALRTGDAILTAGGSSVDAVVAAIQTMEESPLFNAGIGAVFTNKGTVELDASIMDGHDLRAGAVAAVSSVKSPIELARVIMDQSVHVMMVGEGAEQYARTHGLELVDNSHFHTERRLLQLKRAQERESAGEVGAVIGSEDPVERLDEKFGTVGVVALDMSGDLAAGTSTGGMTNKRFGRVGDSPIIGAGTYADNESCAVSATGHGEYFIRGTIAHDVCAIMRYTGLTLVESANAVIHGRLTEMGGTGGVISMDREGTIAMPFNTAGMYRGFIDVNGTLSISIYND
jgi:beta-aspartyl-peptidase (threonine type)